MAKASIVLLTEALICYLLNITQLKVFPEIWKAELEV